MKAPALEKGLDILESVVRTNEPHTLSQIAEGCGRTVSEIQRMVHILHQRGYLERRKSGAFSPGLKLYELGQFRYPFRHLQTIAEPIMGTLANQLGHSIHLSVEDRGQMLILSETLGSGVASVALKVGSRHPLTDTLSGRILLTNLQGNAHRATRQKIATNNFLSAPSSFFSGVYDLGVPIRHGPENQVKAVLACSWLKLRNAPSEELKLAEALIQAAEDINRQL